MGNTVWRREVCNSYEPVNVILFTGIVTQVGDEQVMSPASVTCVGQFHGGEFCHKIQKVDGGYQWSLDLQNRGVCESFNEAWSMWPAKLTSPDIQRWRRDDYEPDYTKPLPTRKIEGNNRTEQEIRARIARLDARINKLQARPNFQNRTGLHRVVNALKATKAEEIENIKNI